MLEGLIWAGIIVVHSSHDLRSYVALELKSHVAMGSEMVYIKRLWLIRLKEAYENLISDQTVSFGHTMQGIFLNKAMSSNTISTKYFSKNLHLTSACQSDLF
jgi:hypothetical protein